MAGVYETLRGFERGSELPYISTELDSVRAYQFEVTFFGLQGAGAESDMADLTLAAKKVTGVEYSVEPIVIDRVNDKVFYPGRPTPGDLVVTFDNFYNKEIASDLWRYFTTVYDPITGAMEKFTEPGGNDSFPFKIPKMEIVQLDNAMTPHSTVGLYGVWPTKWSAAEFNYSTNDFHSIDVTFKYDFMNQSNNT